MSRETKMVAALLVGGNFDGREIEITAVDGEPILKGIQVPRERRNIPLRPTTRPTMDELQYEPYRLVAKLDEGKFIYVAERAFEKGW